jgi:hypothetical protein
MTAINALNTATATYGTSIYDTTNTNAYFNGAKVEDVSRSANVSLDVCGNQVLGCYLNLGGNVAGYQLLSFRVYDRILSATEIDLNHELDQKRFISPPVVTLDTESCANVVVLSTTQLQCTAPAHAEGSVAVSITSGDKTDTSLTYTYVNADAMTVNKVEPNVGPSFGGTWIKVSGANFGDDAVNVDSVTVAGETCVIKERSTDYVKCEIPEVDIDESTLVDVVVTSGDKTYKLEKSFEYVKVSRNPISANVE